MKLYSISRRTCKTHRNCHKITRPLPRFWPKETTNFTLKTHHLHENRIHEIVNDTSCKCLVASTTHHALTDSYGMGAQTSKTSALCFSRRMPLCGKWNVRLDSEIHDKRENFRHSCSMLTCSILHLTRLDHRWSYICNFFKSVLYVTINFKSFHLY